MIPPHSRWARSSILLVVAGLSFHPGRLEAGDPASPTYERDIKPIFARRCVVCHNPAKVQDEEISGGLALDSLERTLAGTRRHRVVVPGKSAASELVLRIREEDTDLRMPLNEEPLPEPQRELIRRWIDAGTPRGVPDTAIASPTVPSRRRSSRHGKRLDVVIPLGVKSFDVTLPIGPLPAVTSLRFRDDDRLLAVGTYGRVVLWDLVEARPVATIDRIPGSVHGLAFTRDGRRLAIGAGLPARSGVLRVYSIPDGTRLFDLPGHEDVVYSLAIRPDGARLASASFDQTVRVWDLASGAAVGSFGGHSEFVYAVAYSPDGRTLFTAGKDRTIKRLEAGALKEERTYSGHDQDVLALAVHPDGKRFTSAGEEPQIRWWTMDGKKPEARRGGHSGPVHQLAFSRDGKRLVSAAGDRSVRLWDGTTGAALRVLNGPVDWQYAVAITADGHRVASGGWDGRVYLWDADTGRLLAVLIQPQQQEDRSSASAEAVGSEWLAATTVGYVAGSPRLIAQAHWRSGGAAMAARKVEATCVRPDAVARVLRGETVPAVSFVSPPARKP